MAGKGMNAGKARTDWARVHANRATLDMRPWRLLDWGDDCPECGCMPEVRTEAEEPNTAYDGDEIRCTGCKLGGYSVVSGAGHNWVNWLGPHWLGALPAAELLSE